MPLFNIPQAVPPLYMALTDKTIVNTTTETSTFSTTAYGSKTIPAGRLQQSTTINIQGGGIYTVPTLTPGAATIKVKVGGTVVASSTVSNLVGGVTNGAFQFDCALVIRTTGTTGTVAPVGGLNFATTAGARTFTDLLNGGSDATVNTTIANDVDVTFTWATASTDRSITVRGTIVTLVN